VCGTLQEFFKKHRREVPSAAHAPTGSPRLYGLSEAIRASE